MRSIACVAAALGCVATASDVAGVTDHLKNYEKALPFKPELYKAVDEDTVQQHIDAAKEAGESSPNYFKVSDNSNEWMMLPEVFSKLKDDDILADFAVPGDKAAEGDARDTRWWGRLYIDGWPQTVQYLRAHFGDPPPKGMHQMVMAEPADSCSQLPSSVKNKIVVAHRGNCTFGTKGKIAHAAGAAALVLVNNEPGNQHVPGPDAHDLAFSVSMVAQDDGILLAKALSDPSVVLTSAMVPIHCVSDSKTVQTTELCRPASTEDRELTESLVVGGWASAEGTSEKYEFLIGKFGTKVPVTGLQVVEAEPANACKALTNDVAGKAVIVQRGKCNFIDKAEKAVEAGAAMVIVANMHTSISRFGVEPRWRGLKIDVPTLMVTDLGAAALSKYGKEGKTVKFTLSSQVTDAVWTKVESYRDLSAWESKKGKDKGDMLLAVYKGLVKEFAGWPERISAVKEGYELISGNTAPDHSEL